MPSGCAERALAKVNLTLRVVGRRPDGYHDLESLVVFASVGDALMLAAGPRLLLTVRGPTASSSGALADNLVLKAGNALAERVEGLKYGRFVLSKRLPVAAGLGGGSADAAAALRLLARRNHLALDDWRLCEAARERFAPQTAHHRHDVERISHVRAPVGTVATAVRVRVSASNALLGAPFQGTRASPLAIRAPRLRRTSPARPA